MEKSPHLSLTPLISPRYVDLTTAVTRKILTTLVHQDRKPTWYIFVGDHKLNRIFVPPTKFTDMGPGSTRTIKLSFQAPMGPGLYTFQAYVMCDSFAGTDVQRDMRVRYLLRTGTSAEILTFFGR